MNRDQSTTNAISDTEKFRNKYVLPYKNMYLRQEGFYEGVQKLIDLIDNEGHCPSIVPDTKVDCRYKELPKWATDILSGVTLIEHTLRVAETMIDLWQADNRDHETFIPLTTVAALGHGLGKMPLYQEDPYYGGGDHAPIGSDIVKSIFKGKDIHLLDKAITAIKEHHQIVRPTSDQFTIFLRRADRIAREIEISQATELQRKSWISWFDPYRFLTLLKKERNKIQDNNGYKAFSYNGIVYCQPTYLLETAGRLALKKGVIDLRLLKKAHQSDDEKEEALFLIIDSLRRINAVYNIGEGYYGRMFKVEAYGEKWGKTIWKKDMFLTPLKTEFFGLPSKLEKVKRSYPWKIEVSPWRR